MKNIVFILLSFCLAGEMEVDGDLKVTGTVDANGNPITNVGAALSMTAPVYDLDQEEPRFRLVYIVAPHIAS